jgi:hypothetical protein
MRFRLTRPDGRLGPSEWVTKGDAMGREARIGLLLGASACLLAVMVDWVIEELNQPAKTRSGN